MFTQMIISKNKPRLMLMALLSIPAVISYIHIFYWIEQLYWINPTCRWRSAKKPSVHFIKFSRRPKRKLAFTKVLHVIKSCISKFSLLCWKVMEFFKISDDKAWSFLFKDTKMSKGGKMDERIFCTEPSMY